jgi:hypothetical protein
LRVVCKGVIPVMANRSIRAGFATKEWNPVPAILHRQSTCWRHRTFLMLDVTSVKPICGGLFRFKRIGASDKASLLFHFL